MAALSQSRTIPVRPLINENHPSNINAPLPPPTLTKVKMSCSDAIYDNL
jgi:hypothetical protein